MKKLVPVLALLGLAAAVGAAEPEAKRKPKFTIGKETTVVAEPVDKDGYIDYAAALNKRRSQGVTADNNAVAHLCRVFGPRPEGGLMPAEFYTWLGIKSPPEKGDYLVPLFRFAKDTLKIPPGAATDQLFEQMDRVGKRPWTAKEFPHLAAWLESNDKPLALATQAVKRPMYFFPLVPGKSDKGSGGLIGALLPGVQKCRELASALTARAMLWLGQGHSDAAWQDLLTCHRLARHVARGSTLIEGLVGVAIDSVATNADLAYLENAKLKTEAILMCLGDLRHLPSMPPMAEKVALAERFMFLDTVMLVDRHGISYLEGLAGGFGAGPKVPAAVVDKLLKDIDWDPAMRHANRWYDRLSAAMLLKERRAREKSFDEMEGELKKLKRDLVESGAIAKALLADKTTAAERGKVLGDVLIGLLMPAVRKVQQAGDRIEQIQRNLHVAFALAAYRADKGTYPAKLDALAPKYLTQVPGDLFSGKTLMYKPSKEGYLLYSVGANGKDDGGRGFEDDPRGDDLPVRMPLPKK